MSRSTTPSDDIVNEFRLRRWARENYVPLEDRDPTWHAIVLDEMAHRDAERAELAATHSTSSAGYVPLAPIELNRLHGPHEAVREPNFLQTHNRSSVPAEWL